MGSVSALARELELLGSPCFFPPLPVGYLSDDDDRTAERRLLRPRRSAGDQDRGGRSQGLVVIKDSSLLFDLHLLLDPRPELGLELELRRRGDEREVSAGDGTPRRRRGMRVGTPSPPPHESLAF
ncbi:uncharacterized protein A4U43_C08F21150 [Asparagus officinalis]|nr:uncharacterized protein A4U43_C08F21150 [Asparagus officinalis]